QPHAHPHRRAPARLTREEPSWTSVSTLPGRQPASSTTPSKRTSAARRSARSTPRLLRRVCGQPARPASTHTRSTGTGALRLRTPDPQAPGRPSCRQAAGRPGSHPDHETGEHHHGTRLEEEARAHRPPAEGARDHLPGVARRLAQARQDAHPRQAEEGTAVSEIERYEDHAPTRPAADTKPARTTGLATVTVLYPVDCPAVARVQLLADALAA